MQSSQTPCKMLTLGIETKKSTGTPFKVHIIKAEYAKKNKFGGHFPTEQNGLTD